MDFGFQAGGFIIQSGLTFLGSWNALTNNPTLTSGVGLQGGYYIVSTAGTTDLDGTTDWQVGDWAIFNGTTWQKIDNHDIVSYNTIQNQGVSLPQQSVIDFQGNGVIASNSTGKTIVTINGTPPPTTYGVFAQTQISNTVTNTNLPTSIIGTGVGTLTVPANSFAIGDSFNFSMGGELTCQNNTDVTIEILSDGIVLASTGVIRLGSSTNRSWRLDTDFTIRNIGGVGVASIVTNGQFSYSRNNNFGFEGKNFNSVNSTTFSTLISNTLDIKVTWAVASTNSSIHSDLFVLEKTY